MAGLKDDLAVTNRILAVLVNERIQGSIKIINFFTGLNVMIQCDCFGAATAERIRTVERFHNVELIDRL